MLTAEASRSSLENWTRLFSGWIEPASAKPLLCAVSLQDSTANAPASQHYHVICMLNQRNSLVWQSGQVPEVGASVHTLMFLGPPRTSTAKDWLSNTVCKHLLGCMTYLTLHKTFTKVVFPDDLVLLADPRRFGDRHSQVAPDLIGHPLRICSAKTHDLYSVGSARSVISADICDVRCRQSMFRNQTECMAVV